jgi:hypothetical protein
MQGEGYHQGYGPAGFEKWWTLLQSEKLQIFYKEEM